MKKLFFLMVAVMVATASYAQSSLLATLSHDGNIKAFYGSSAFKEAYSAAVDGDVITLSSGTFTATYISKGLTIRGAGMGFDTESQTEPTILQGDFNIDVSETSKLTVEGVYCNNTITVQNLYNATFLKSRFKEIKKSTIYSSTMKNVSFIHCRISNLLQLDYGSISCVNSIIWYPENKQNTDSNFEFTNCVVYRGPWAHQDLYRATFKNSILIETTAALMPESNSYYSTVGVCSDGDTNIFAKVTNTSNKQVTGYSNLFKTFTGNYNDDETFELTDEAAQLYKGNDGTQVGVYGGNLPFSSTPTNPQITKCNVASKTTADGKLSIDIEVKSAE